MTGNMAGYCIAGRLLRQALWQTTVLSAICIKSKIHGGGRIYKFDNVAECIQSLQSIKKDEWATEANIALDYHIAILDELEEISDVRNLQQN